MQGHGWQQVEKVTVPNGGNVDVTLAPNRPILTWMTVWASSGGKNLTNMTFQVRINGQNFGAAVNVAGAVAADIVYSPGADVNTFPVGKTNPAEADPFVMTVNCANAGANPEDVTIYIVATGHDGGSP